MSIPVTVSIPVTSGTPKNQITLRTLPEDVEAFRNLHEHIKARSIVPPKSGDLHRIVYHKGLVAWYAELNIQFPGAEVTADIPKQ